MLTKTERALQALTNPIWQLSHLGLIKLSGNDALTYLQGQVSCDVTDVRHNVWVHGTHNDAKGKLLANFYLWQQDQALMLLLEKTAIAASLTALQKFAVFSNVEIADVSADYELSGKLTEAHEHNLSVTENAVLTIAANISQEIHVSPVMQNATSSTESPDLALWRAAEILNGRPWLPASAQFEYVAQQLNLQALAAINFRKGCYIGQETVARTHYLGRNKRAGAILVGPGVTNVPQHAILEQQFGEHWRRVGHVINSAILSDETLLFACLPNDLSDDCQLRLHDHPQVRFQLLPLPYQLEEV